MGGQPSPQAGERQSGQECGHLKTYSARTFFRLVPGAIVEGAASIGPPRLHCFEDEFRGLFCFVLVLHVLGRMKCWGRGDAAILEEWGVAPIPDSCLVLLEPIFVMILEFLELSGVRFGQERKCFLSPSPLPHPSLCKSLVDIALPSVETQQPAQ